MKVHVSDAVRITEELNRDLLESLAFDPIRARLEALAGRLLRTHELGNSAAVVQISNWHPQLVGQSSDEILNASFRMDDARATLAREYGFADWEHVDALVDLCSDPDFEASVDALVLGEIRSLRACLQSRPELVEESSRYGHGATLLHYVASNGVETHRQKVPENLAEITELLVESGADVNATMQVYGGEHTTLELLSTSSHPAEAGVAMAVAAVLKNAGAVHSE